MSVRYKFKNDLEFSAVPLDGFHVSVHDLKRAIVRQKRLGRTTDFDLDVINHQDNKVFEDAEALIPKNSSLVIVRRPLPKGQQKVWEEEQILSTSTSSSTSGSGGGIGASSIAFGVNKDMSEEDKIDAMISNSTELYDQKNWVKYRGKALYGNRPPPPNYNCNKCHQGGHWMGDCPLLKSGHLGVELKKTTGIPRSFLTPANKDTPGAKINPQGLFMVNELEKQAYMENRIDKPVWDTEESSASNLSTAIEIPDDLKCPVCKELLRDCVMMPQCACALCDECARNGLIESDKNACPSCGDTTNSPEELIPWRALREKVNAFRNSNGYAAKAEAAAAAARKKEADKMPTLPDIVLPDLKGESTSRYHNLASASASAEASPYYSGGSSPKMPLSGDVTPNFTDGSSFLPGMQSDAIGDDSNADLFPSPTREPLKSPGTPLEEDERQSPPPPVDQPPRVANVTGHEETQESRSRVVPLPDTSLPPPGFNPQYPPMMGGAGQYHSYRSDGYQGYGRRPHSREGGYRAPAGYGKEIVEAFERAMQAKDNRHRYDRHASPSYNYHSYHPRPRRYPPSPPHSYRRDHRHPRLSRSPSPPKRNTPPVRGSRPHSPDRAPGDDPGPRTPTQPHPRSSRSQTPPPGESPISEADLKSPSARRSPKRENATSRSPSPSPPPRSSSRQQRERSHGASLERATSEQKQKRPDRSPSRDTRRQRSQIKEERHSMSPERRRSSSPRTRRRSLSPPPAKATHHTRRSTSPQRNERRPPSHPHASRHPQQYSGRGRSREYDYYAPQPAFDPRDSRHNYPSGHYSGDRDRSRYPPDRGQWGGRHPRGRRSRERETDGYHRDEVSRDRRPPPRERHPPPPATSPRRGRHDEPPPPEDLRDRREHHRQPEPEGGSPGSSNRTPSLSPEPEENSKHRQREEDLARERQQQQQQQQSTGGRDRRDRHHAEARSHRERERTRDREDSERAQNRREESARAQQRRDEEKENGRRHREEREKEREKERERPVSPARTSKGLDRNERERSREGDREAGTEPVDRDKTKAEKKKKRKKGDTKEKKKKKKKKQRKQDSDAESGDEKEAKEKKKKAKKKRKRSEDAATDFNAEASEEAPRKRRKSESDNEREERKSKKKARRVTRDDEGEGEERIVLVDRGDRSLEQKLLCLSGMAGESKKPAEKKLSIKDRLGPAPTKSRSAATSASNRSRSDSGGRRPKK